MKKQSLLAGITLITFMVACIGPNAVSDVVTGDEGTENNTLETGKETDKESDEGSATVDAADYEAQLNLFAEDYDNWISEIKEWQAAENDDDEYKIAVTDLNRNGRLELICTSLQGTGLFCVTFILEPDESQSNLVRLNPLDRNDGVDQRGDFIRHSDFNCYKKDGIYYYALDDYTPSGANVIEDCLYAYSFEGCIKRELIGGYHLHIDEFDYDRWCAKTVSVKFYDTDKAFLGSSEELDKVVEDYWADYEKQPCVHVEWVDIPEKTDCLKALKNSLDGYNEESEQNGELLPDYRSFHSETTEYTVRTPNSQ